MSNITPAATQALFNGDEENFKAASTPGGIEAQEAAGQVDFCLDQTLPIDCPKEELEKLGFIFGDEVDEIFIQAQFPDGWTKQATDHSMHTDLLDEKGRKRANIFYKAAFYDRRASLTLTRRYSVRQDYDLKNSVLFQVFDSDNVIFQTEERQCKQYSAEFFSALKILELTAIEYLKNNYPNWMDATAYWD